MTGDPNDMIARLQAALPRGWFGDDAPVMQALLSGTAWAQSTIYSQITYAALQTRIKTATGSFLDIISADFFGIGNLPRLPNEADSDFRVRILANLFIKGPRRADMSKVLTLVTGRVPSIFEPSNTEDSGGWDGGAYWDIAGGWGDPLPYQAFVTAYRPIGGDIDLGEWDAWRMAWDAYGAYSDTTPTSITDAAIISAVESTRPLGVVVWLRIADNPITP